MLELFKSRLAPLTYIVYRPSLFVITELSMYKAASQKDAMALPVGMNYY